MKSSTRPTSVPAGFRTGLRGICVTIRRRLLCGDCLGASALPSLTWTLFTATIARNGRARRGVSHGAEGARGLGALPEEALGAARTARQPRAGRGGRRGGGRRPVVALLRVRGRVPRPVRNRRPRPDCAARA